MKKMSYIFTGVVVVMWVWILAVVAIKSVYP